jgi:putative endonuclease
MPDICCYIIYSANLNKFYIGACQESISERIKKHNEHAYGTHRFTAATDDWDIFLRIEANDYSQAIRIERKIKSMKSKVYIQNLKKYPEIVEKLKLL